MKQVIVKCWDDMHRVHDEDVPAEVEVTLSLSVGLPGADKRDRVTGSVSLDLSKASLTALTEALGPWYRAGNAQVPVDAAIAARTPVRPPREPIDTSGLKPVERPPVNGITLEVADVPANVVGRTVNGKPSRKGRPRNAEGFFLYNTNGDPHTEADFTRFREARERRASTPAWHDGLDKEERKEALDWLKKQGFETRRGPLSPSNLKQWQAHNS